MKSLPISRRAATASLLVAVTGLYLTGCGGGGSQSGSTSEETSSKPSDSIVVGFSQVGAESSWRTAETASIKAEAERLGVELKFSDAQGKQENQIKALRGFIAQGVDAIILAPVVETGWEPVLKEAKRASIPVVLVDRGIDVEDDSLYFSLIASDFVKEGEMAGEWLAEKTGGKAKIIELQGTTGAAPAIDRQKGFMNIISKHEGMEIIASQSGDFRRSGGKEVMEALLKQHGDKVTAVYAHNDDMALGAIQAIEEAGKKPGEDVIILSIDGVKGAFEAMVAGKLNCTVECSPLLGPLAFRAIQAATTGLSFDKLSINEDRIFDRSQAEAELPNRQY